MSGWTALSVPAVREQSLRDALLTEGIDWNAAHHLTATTSLASALRTAGTGKEAPAAAEETTHALPLATLIDLVVLPGWLGDMRLPLAGFPQRDVLVSGGLKEYRQAVRRWQQEASGRRMRMGIAVDDCLRRVARSGRFGSETGRALVAARRDFARSVHTLVASGVAPTDLVPADDLTALSLAAWELAEREVPALSGARHDLWHDLEQFASQSTHEARDLMTRIRAALEKAFGSTSGRRQIVYHGFYFYTPPQWALFQLLRHVPEVDQCFVVHDDGTNPCFETWRRFFIPALGMPEPRPVGSDGSPTIMASALRHALEGRPVEATALEGSLQVIECRSPTEMVRELATERRNLDLQRGRDEPELRVFAADADTVERYVKRLGRGPADGDVDLAHLPVGQFLLSLHDCIRPGASATSRVDIRPDVLLDIASSGFVNVQSPVAGARAAAAVRRALPYFQDCRSSDEWVQRAEQLLLLVESEVNSLGERRDEDSDVERVAVAVWNPLRTVPWADLSTAEATYVRDVVAATVATVGRLAARERVRLRDHVLFIRGELERGMRDVPEALRVQITAQVDGFGVGLDAEIDADGLVDVVAMLLGREVAPEIGLEPDPQGGSLDHLRGVDGLGFRRQPQDIHVANLVDTVFPGRVSPVGWPFRLQDLRSSSKVNGATTAILATRAETAAMSDLYLFWLALDGVEAGKKVVLSWISDIAGDPRNPSALLSLLTDPTALPRVVRHRVGGLPVEHVSSPADMEARTSTPEPTGASGDPTEVEAAAAKLPHPAASSAVVCARRFAIQWALGPSSAFQAEHHHAMLYGSVYGALVKGEHLAAKHARELCDDLWAFLTPGQRASSEAKTVVKPTGPAADPLWILTLAGSRTGQRPLDRGYQAALGLAPLPPDALVGEGHGFLAAGTDDEEACRACPVRSHCAHARDRED
jgi:hypothetical protein